MKNITKLLLSAGVMLITSSMIAKDQPIRYFVCTMSWPTVSHEETAKVCVDNCDSQYPSTIDIPKTVTVQGDTVKGLRWQEHCCGLFCAKGPRKECNDPWNCQYNDVTFNFAKKKFLAAANAMIAAEGITKKADIDKFINGLWAKTSGRITVGCDPDTPGCDAKKLEDLSDDDRDAEVMDPKDPGYKG